MRQRSGPQLIQRCVLAFAWMSIFVLGGCIRAEPTVRSSQGVAPAPTATRVAVVTSTLPPEPAGSPSSIVVQVASPTPWLMVVVANVQGNVRSAPSDGGKIIGAVPKAMLKQKIEAVLG